MQKHFSGVWTVSQQTVLQQLDIHKKKKMKPDLLLTLDTKINSNLVNWVNLNVRYKIIKFLGKGSRARQTGVRHDANSTTDKRETIS